MALSGLFSSNLVSTQEDSALLPRCLQEGCEVINLKLSLAGSATNTQYTVTAKKKVYIQQISVNCTTTWDGSVEILDNVTSKFYFPPQSVPMGCHTFNFETPLEFATSIKTTTSSGAGTAHVTIVGWEE